MNKNEDKNPKPKKTKRSARGPKPAPTPDLMPEGWEMGHLLLEKVEEAKKRGLIKVKKGENALRAELRYILDVLWESFPEWRWN